jgi:hypothetical protein
VYTAQIVAFGRTADRLRVSVSHGLGKTCMKWSVPGSNR